MHKYYDIIVFHSYYNIQLFSDLVSLQNQVVY